MCVLFVDLPRRLATTLLGTRETYRMIEEKIANRYRYVRLSYIEIIEPRHRFNLFSRIFFLCVTHNIQYETYTRNRMIWGWDKSS